MSDEEFFESIKNDQELAKLKRKLILKGKVKSRVKLNYKCPKGTKSPDTNECLEGKTAQVQEEYPATRPIKGVLLDTKNSKLQTKYRWYERYI